MKPIHFQPIINRSIQVILAVSVTTLMTLSACTNSKNTTVAEGNKKQILHIGNGTELSDIDPHVVTGVPEDHVIRSMFETLVALHPQTEKPIPGQAESWTISKDQKIYTFKIRKNAKWSNGDPFTAKDMVYSWKRLLTPALASEYAYMLFYVKNAEKFNKGEIKDFAQVGVKAVDDHTLRIELNTATPFFLDLLLHHSTYPVHQATIEKHGKIDTRGTPWTRPENIVTNGPFNLKRWELNKVLVVEKNPLYWNAANVRLNAIHFYPIDSQQVEEKAFRAGELHITNEVPLPKIAVYKKENPEFLKIDPFLGTYYYLLNVTKKPLNDVRVRKALNYSIDRQAIVERVTKGGQLPAFNLSPPGIGGFTATAKTEFNIEKARQLLTEAGYPGGKGMPPVEILFNTSESHKTVAEAIQQMWKTNLGIDVTLSNQDWKVYLDSQKTLNYSICRRGWIGDYNDPNNFVELMVKDGGNNHTGWSNPEYDRLLAQSLLTPDTAKRFAIYQKLEQMLVDEAPIIPIYTYTRVVLRRPEVKNWYPTLMDRHNYSVVYLDDGTGAGAGGTSSSAK